MATSADSIQTDAEPEELLTGEDARRQEETFGRHLEPGNVIHKRSSRGHEHMKYLSWFPPHLKEEDTHILILCAEEDIDEANLLKKQIKQNVRFDLNEQIKAVKPKIKLPDGGVDHLDKAIPKTVFVFLFLTDSFCKNQWNKIEGLSCLKREHEDNACFVIPVHARPEYKYTPPIMLNAARSLNYLKESFFKDVKKLLESESGVILKRESDLEIQRIKYFKMNRVSILQKSELLKCKYKRDESSTRENVEKSFDFPAHGTNSICDSDSKQQKTDSVNQALQKLNVIEKPTCTSQQKTHQSSAVRVNQPDSGGEKHVERSKTTSSVPGIFKDHHESIHSQQPCVQGSEEVKFCDKAKLNNNWDPPTVGLMPVLFRSGPEGSDVKAVPESSTEASSRQDHKECGGGSGDAREANGQSFNKSFETVMTDTSSITTLSGLHGNIDIGSVEIAAINSTVNIIQSRIRNPASADDEEEDISIG